MGVDPKVFFANERTYLHWLNVAVTLGSIGSGMIGFAGVGDKDGEGGLAMLRTIGLLLLLVSLIFTGNAMVVYHRRGQLLRKRSGDGYDTATAPTALTLILIASLSGIYVFYIYKNTFGAEEQGAPASLEAPDVAAGP